MATKKIMQGDSYSLRFTLTLNEETNVTPDMVSEVELCIGNDEGAEIRKTYTAGEVWYDNSVGKWFFRLSQENTLGMDPGSYGIIVRPKFKSDVNADVIGVKIGNVVIIDTYSEEVI